jgi:hypothetical protein
MMLSVEIILYALEQNLVLDFLFLNFGMCLETFAIIISSNNTNLRNVNTGLKVTVSVYEPSLVLCDDMYSIFSTPLTCCSIGAATVWATTWALAPG